MLKLNRVSLLVLCLLPIAATASAQTSGDQSTASLRSLAQNASLPPNGLSRASSMHEGDPVWNGALIGAGTAVAGSLLLCRAMEPWEVCRDDVGSMVKSAAIGAAIGIGIDALVRRASTTSPVDRARRPDGRRWHHFLTRPARR
jgi:hypothetical protein